jgi:hypothetical protein
MKKVPFPTYFLATFTAILAGCNPVQDAKDALSAKEKSDSILNEFNKVNEGLKQVNQSKPMKINTDSVLRFFDSIPGNDTSAGVGAFRRG